MPVSLITSNLNSPSVTNITSSVIKKKFKTTNQMVADALIEFHTAKGITLRKVYSYISSVLQVDTLPKQRVTLIRKYLNNLRESEEIILLNGKDFRGHFKLVDKGKFIKKFTDVKTTKKFTDESRRAIKESEPIVKKDKLNKEILSKQKKLIAPVKPRQITPLDLRYTNTSMFDTPMVTTQVEASTPFISNINVPQAPEIMRKSRRKKISKSEANGTPRSSLPKKQRRLHKRAE